MHEIFDARYYGRQAGRSFDDPAAWHHFQAEGDSIGLDPSPYFSTGFYKRCYRDWDSRGATTALDDFLVRVAEGEDRQPHPLIDPAHYRAAHSDLAELGAEAVLHFAIHGDREGRSPSAGFDAAFYRRCYLPLGAGYPFRHYMTEGAACGFLPRPERRSPEVSKAAMARLVAGLAHPFLLVAHDAQAAGVPILTLDLARDLRRRGWDPVFLLGNAGPLLEEFRAHGPVLIHAEGWDVDGLALGLPPGTPALMTTAAAAMLAAPLAQGGLNCLLLIHEMADYLAGQGLMPHLRAARKAGVGLVVSMPRMAQALAEDPGGVVRIRPGIVLPQTPLAAFRQARARRQGATGPMFIGAGHADRRKGFDLFLGAARRILAERADAHFIWLGALDPWARGLADAALAEGLPLTLPGFVRDSLAWYRAADVYLLTSRQDAGPTTAIHAAALGTPFVGYAADIGLIGLTEGVGHFLPSGDEAGFAAAALAVAAGVTPASRRRLRRSIRQATGFDSYVSAILDRLGAAADGAA